MLSLEYFTHGFYGWPLKLTVILLILNPMKTFLIPICNSGCYNCSRKLTSCSSVPFHFGANNNPDTNHDALEAFLGFDPGAFNTNHDYGTVGPSRVPGRILRRRLR